MLPLGAQSRGTPVPWAGGAGSGFPKRKTPGTGRFREWGDPPGVLDSAEPRCCGSGWAPRGGGGERIFCSTGSPRQEHHPVPGEEGVPACVPGVLSIGVPSSHHPFCLITCQAGERELRWVAKPSTQDAAVSRGEGCGKSSRCRGRMLSARIPRESGERPASSPGSDGDLPGGTDLLKYLPRGRVGGKVRGRRSLVQKRGFVPLVSAHGVLTLSRDRPGPPHLAKAAFAEGSPGASLWGRKKKHKTTNQNTRGIFPRVLCCRERGWAAKRPYSPRVKRQHKAGGAGAAPAKAKACGPGRRGCSRLYLPTPG